MRVKFGEYLIPFGPELFDLQFAFQKHKYYNTLTVGMQFCRLIIKMEGRALVHI